MAEGGVKAWEPHQVQSPLAFSDEEEEDLLDFMYKYKTLRKTEFPLEVHGVWAGGERVFVQGRRPGDLGVLEAVSWDTQHCRAPGREALLPSHRWPALGSIQLFAKGQKRP